MGHHSVELANGEDADSYVDTDSYSDAAGRAIPITSTSASVATAHDGRAIT